MTVYSFYEYTQDGGVLKTVTRQQILDQYLQYWFEQQTRRHGLEYTLDHYTTEDCVQDWCTIHWAWTTDE